MRSTLRGGVTSSSAELRPAFASPGSSRPCLSTGDIVGPEALVLPSLASYTTLLSASVALAVSQRLPGNPLMVGMRYAVSGSSRVYVSTGHLIASA
eukprot:3453194-Rhodomonas_salina.4